ncbi:hypothetical protein GCM10009616_17580 [Microlunatus lacustris]
MPESAGEPDRSRPDRLLTVAIPVFNGKALLRLCLQSVLDSTLPRDRFEIVVADDGSTEPETRAILEELQESLAAEPGFFRVLRARVNSGGAARPRNRILDEARGEYVFFVDADDTIGNEALERIADALAATPADWVALNQVPVNGRGGHFAAARPRAEVSRARALSTLTVHKVFRRAEIERQGLRFDTGLPSGQDLRFAFSYLLNAERFLVLGGYDFYHLTHHKGDPTEPAHLSQRSRTARARIQKNERILGAMLQSLHASPLPLQEQRSILGQVCLPRMLLREGYLRAIVRAGPAAGSRALRRLARLLADPLVAGLDPAELHAVTPEHLAVIAREDWHGLAQLVGGPVPAPPAHRRVAERWVLRGRHVVDTASGRTRHRRLLREIRQLRRAVDDLKEGQLRIESALHRSADPDPGRARPGLHETPGDPAP